MNADKLGAALDALTALIQEQLASEERDRFARIGRIATLAQRLQSENVRRVADVARAMDADGRVILGYDGDEVYAGQAALIANPRTDLAAMMRELFVMLGPKVASDRDANHARERESTAVELRELVSAREQLAADHPARISLDLRITELSQWFATGGIERNEANGIEVVPADDVRRHHIDGDEYEAD
jgi:hypothetical protein